MSFHPKDAYRALANALPVRQRALLAEALGESPHVPADPSYADPADREDVLVLSSALSDAARDWISRLPCSGPCEGKPKACLACRTREQAGLVVEALDEMTIALVRERLIERERRR